MVVVVERDRRVAGDVLLRKGHMERDCLRRASIVKIQIQLGELITDSAIDSRVWEELTVSALTA